MKDLALNYFTGSSELKVLILLLMAFLMSCCYPLILTRSGGEEFLPILGRKCSLLARENGQFEVWIYPFKAIWRGETAFVKNEKETHLSQIPRNIIVSPACSSIILDGETKGRVDLLCSNKEPVCLLQYHILKETADKLILRFEPSLQLMWPAFTEGEVKTRIEERNRLVFSRKTGGMELHFVISCDKPFQFYEKKLEIEVGDGEISVVISGGVDNLEEVYTLIDRYLGEYQKLMEENETEYRDYLRQTTELITSNAYLNEAFSWAKVGLEKCFLETSLGDGFIAGYHMAGEGNRPGFAWFFGRDSAWMSFAALALGDFTKVRENLLLQRKYQIKEGVNKGKIYHELSLAHDFVSDPSYAYPAGDSTPFYVIVCGEYAKWSGDLDFLRENWESIYDAMEWCERMDVDGDLLIDNPPAGHQWFDYGEKNMIDLVAIWQKALEEGAWIAKILGKTDLEERWLDKVKKINQILNNDFWNGKRGYFYDRKLPDGSFLDLATCNPLIPMLWRQIEEEKAQIALTLVNSSSFTIDWGVRTTAKDEKIYNPWGYHEGTVWPLVTGWASLAQFSNCRPGEGYRLLLSNAMMTRDFCLGYIPEILNGDKYEAGGCPLQGWSEAMVILPTLKGILGLEPNAPEKRLRLIVHIPKDIDFLRVNNIRVGHSRWNIEWKGGSKAVFKIKKDGEGEYLITLEISWMYFGQARGFVDGNLVKIEKIRKPCGYHFALTTLLKEGLEMELF